MLQPLMCGDYPGQHCLQQGLSNLHPLCMTKVANLLQGKRQLNILSFHVLCSLSGVSQKSLKRIFEQLNQKQIQRHAAESLSKRVSGASRK